jgi:hypothetical protein
MPLRAICRCFAATSFTCVLSFVLSADSLFAAAARNPLQTSICAIANNPAKFNGKLVTLHAEYFTDYHHGSVLLDYACERTGITPEFADKVKGGDSLDQALRVGGWMNFDKRIEANFVGRFAWRPKGRHRRILHLDSITDVEVTDKRTGGPFDPEMTSKRIFLPEEPLPTLPAESTAAPVPHL